jgi:hypothetical protein
MEFSDVLKFMEDGVISLGSYGSAPVRYFLAENIPKDIKTIMRRSYSIYYQKRHFE